MNKFKKLNPKARIAFLITSLIINIIIFSILLCIKLALKYFHIGNPIMFYFNIVFYIVVILLIINIILEPTLGYNIYRYRINDESIETIDGIFYNKHEIIPIRRMQQIAVNRGPINKLFNLATLEITTAGSIQHIHCIDLDEANELSIILREKINLFAKNEVNHDQYK